MKPGRSFHGLFALAFAVLIATNVWVLGGAAYNRTGVPEATASLTERELPTPYRVPRENSGLSLGIAWRSLGKDPNDFGTYASRFPGWFDAEKLEALGFDTGGARPSDKDGVFAKQPVEKEVFIVLENDGPAYREALKRAENAREKAKDLFRSNPEDQKLRNKWERARRQYRRERIAASRLFAVDAGLDPRRLRGLYGNRTRYMIARGLVIPRYHYEDKKREAAGYILNLSIENINVPLRYRKVLEGLPDKKPSQPDGFSGPRFAVELAYGRRFEPWIRSLRPLGAKPDEPHSD